jgi:hypothetical protein
MKREKKLGKTVQVGEPKRRKGGPVGSRKDNEGLGSPRQGDGAPNDASDVRGGSDVGGVLQRPPLLEQLPVQPGDAVKRRGAYEAKAPKEYELKTDGFTLFRYRASRAKSLHAKKGGAEPHVCLPLASANKMMEAMDYQKKWGELTLESIEEFEAIIANPEWLVQDKAKKIQLIVATMHARITNLTKSL